LDSADVQNSPDQWSLADGALDTLGCIFQTLGNESFPLESDSDPYEFPAQCVEVVRHIENGSAAPKLAIDQLDNGARHWSQVRRFYVDRRINENHFVSNRLRDYRGVVEDLVAGLRQICDQGNQTELAVTQSLLAIQDAIAGGQLPDIRRALADTIADVGDAFTRQKNEHEEQIRILNERMSGLREDLEVAQEEMKLDALTGIHNRGAFDISVSRSINMHFVLNQPISLIMIDVDNFKIINDSCGHAAGDEGLKSVSACLSRAFVRKNDLIARYGGDEFAVLLPDTEADQSQASICRFLDSVQDIQIANLSEDIAITCSAGCTEILDDDSVESLVARADKALYDAKQAGRNCLRFRHHAKD